MKVNKTQASLLILSLLLINGSMSKEQIKSLVDITDLSFKRYMQEVRAFLINFDMRFEIIYRRKEEKYYLKKC